MGAHEIGRRIGLLKLKVTQPRAGEMAQRFTVNPVLAEDWNSGPKSHLRCLTTNSNSRGLGCLWILMHKPTHIHIAKNK